MLGLLRHLAPQPFYVIAYFNQDVLVFINIHFDSLYVFVVFIKLVLANSIASTNRRQHEHDSY